MVRSSSIPSIPRASSAADACAVLVFHPPYIDLQMLLLCSAGRGLSNISEAFHSIVMCMRRHGRLGCSFSPFHLRLRPIVLGFHASFHLP
jgi:hypothetical protein